MISKEIIVDVAANTWPAPGVPAYLSRRSGPQNIDIGEALLMLGTLTMPNIFSIASPARFWAWLRYVFAPADTQDLRICMPFADLDPHQKAILSDDFGVAIATQWLHGSLGGFAEIVDGRQFMLQFSHLLPARTRTPRAKVGPTKCPDFVIRDSRGRWHVLECKGTQSGRDARNRFLRTAVVQKNVVQIVGGMRGERLAIGLSLANERDRQRTHLRVVDPPSSPLITLGDQQVDAATRAIKRLSVARCLSLVGLDAMATELSLPADVGSASDFLRPSEMDRIKTPRKERSAAAIQEAKYENFDRLQHSYKKFSGHVRKFEVPGLGRNAPFKYISIRQGVSSEVIRSFRSIKNDQDFDVEVDSLSQPYVDGAGVRFVSEDDRVVLTYGDLFFCEMRFTKSRS